MPRRRGRGKKRGTTSMTNSNKTSATQCKRKTIKETPKIEDNNSSLSDGSPFKGFGSGVEPLDDEECEVKVSDDEVELVDKNKLFDHLVDPSYKSPLHNKAIRTYSNKRRVCQDNKLLEFQDCKNRDSIIRWLTDTRNVFDRKTQTQCDSADFNDEEVPLTMDMPSVSQVNNKRTRTTRKSPYKTRARSLDIRIKKNSNVGRSKRHSLAGDTPSMENYQIEEVVTDEEVPVPAEKMIVDMIEDEYLDNIEKEMRVLAEKESEKKSVKGWDRLKDFNNTLNMSKKKLKQLKITTLQVTPNKKEDTCYNLDELEHYFVENMQKMIAISTQKTQSSVPETLKNSKLLQETIDIGNNFIIKLEKLSKTHIGNNELHSIASKIRELFNRSCEAGTQTLLLENINKEVQTDVKTAFVEVQTDVSFKCQNCCHRENIINNNKLPDLILSDKIIQTEIFNNAEHSANCCVPEPRKAVQSVITTPSNLSCDKVAPTEGHNLNKPEESEVEIELESLDVCFNTEDILQEGKASPQNITVDEQNIEKARQCLVGENKGVKRLLKSPAQDIPNSHPKRPCNKFINEDLSVDFMSCAEDEATKMENDKVIVLSDSSDDTYFEEFIDKVMQKFEDDSSLKVKGKEVQPEPKLDRSQEQIEEYEALIRTAAKPGPSVVQNTSTINQQRPTSACSSDALFKEADITMTKLEKDLDYFKTDKTPKTRKRLFNSITSQVRRDQFSESLFFSDHGDASADNEDNEEEEGNHTITQDNIDALVEKTRGGRIEDGCEVDKEVEDILSQKTPKVNILQNIVVKSADPCTPKEQIDCSEDVDIVESTPQKKVGSFCELRAESVLDITLPPPLEFQDVEMEPKTDTSGVLPKDASPPRRPLTAINRVTSTPITQNYASQKVNLSPIDSDVGRNLNVIEMAQRSKFLPLTIVKKTPSQKSCHGTPKQSSILNYMRPSQEPQESPKTRRRPYISCSRLNRDQMLGISAMSNKKLAAYSSSFTSQVTHLIVSVDGRNRIREHTIKSVSAIAAGIWVLGYGWVQECLAKSCLVPEEPYEVVDFSGIPGPKISRLTRNTNPLLKGFKIHVLPPFRAVSRSDLENILRLLGAKVVDSLEDLLDKENYICLVIGDRRPTEECPVDLFDDLVEAFRVITVDVDWLSRSVGQYTLHGLRPFTLCSEDDIDNLGYPPELLSDSVSISLLQCTSSVPSL